MISRTHFTALACFAALAVTAAPHANLAQSIVKSFRPPAVPLVTFDPYLSIWSEADHLTGDTTRHWTRHPQALTSMVRIDGRAYRLMGSTPAEVPAMPQVGVKVLPTRSVYEFDDHHIHLTLAFMTTALPHDLDALTRPLSYITWTVRSVDNRGHAVSLYDSTSSQIAVDSPSELVDWTRRQVGALTALRVGTKAQPVFEKAGDDVRINWGYAYAAAPAAHANAAVGASNALEQSFVAGRGLPAADDTRKPRAANDEEPVLAFAMDLGQVSTPISRHVIVAYDELYAIKFFGRPLRPYWRRNGATPATLLAAAERDYVSLAARCEQFDKELMADMTKVGGPLYARIGALAYRQCLAGTGIAADTNRQPLLFTKENTSNGDIATVDVIFPMDPMLLLFSPTLAKASLVPDLLYAASAHWKFPNAPHDLGTYPIARGTDDGGEGMPVEESGNMILLCDAIAHEEGNPSFVARWWPQITQWERYLQKYGNDPEEQLCTDDFMGHLAHNANLSVKAILAIAAYGDLCRMRGDVASGNRIQKLAKGYAAHWVTVAEDGDHSRLAFDKPNTWSQKYNLVWDKILGLNVFPPSVARQEVAYYKKVLQPYGVPLDSRTHLTKTDWSVWSATLADNNADFETLVAPIYNYLNATSARSPLVDSYVTDDIRSDGMHARPVVGGLFVKMLADPAMWKKWSSGDHARVGGWAAIPKPPTITEIIPTSRRTPHTWRYTTDAPPTGWTAPAFDDSAWAQGPGGFGSRGTPGILVNTTWRSADIWIRRRITVPANGTGSLQFLVYHDEDVEVYVDGVLASSAPSFATSYEPLAIRPAARALLKPGAVVTIAAHCHQTGGGQGIDIGLARVAEH